MTLSLAAKKNTGYYLWVAVSLGFMFLFGRIVPPFAGITPLGVSMLGIFFGVLIATIATNETFWPAVLGMSAMVVCGYDSAAGLLSQWFGNTSIQQIIWVMALTGAVAESGAVDVLGRRVLGIRALQGHPLRLIVALFVTVFLCSALVTSPTTMLLLWYPILDSVCGMCAVDKDSDLKRELLLGVYISTMGALILPFDGLQLTGIVVIGAMMEKSGLHFSAPTYLITAALVVLAFILVYALFMKFVWKTDLTPLRNFDPGKMDFKASDLRLSGRQKTLLGFLFFGIGFIIFGMALPKTSAIYAAYSKIGAAWIWIVLFAALCVTRDKQGRPLVNGVKILQSKTMWNILAVAGCFTICSAAIASDELGIKAAIVSLLGPMLSSASWPILIVACVVVSTVFTNFANGMPVAMTIHTVCIPIACALQTSGKGNATVLGAATILSGFCAFLTNASIVYAPIMLGREEMTSRFIFTKGTVTNVIFIAVACALCIALGYML